VEISFPANNIFAELDLYCLFNEGLQKKPARLRQTAIICDFQASMIGRHPIAIFSDGLNRFIHKGSFVIVKPKPAILRATQEVIFDSLGTVLSDINVHFDSMLGGVSSVVLDLRSDGDSYQCPCDFVFDHVTCMCEKAPLFEQYSIGFLFDAISIHYVNQLRFLPMPQIEDTMPKVLKPTDSA